MIELYLIVVGGLYLLAFSIMGFSSKSRPSALPERYRK